MLIGNTESKALVHSTPQRRKFLIALIAVLMSDLIDSLMHLLPATSRSRHSFVLNEGRFDERIWYLESPISSSDFLLSDSRVSRRAFSAGARSYGANSRK